MGLATILPPVIKKSLDAPKAPRFLSLFRRVTTSGGFIAEIDGLRFIAIFTVVFFHLAVSLSIKAPQTYARPASNLLALIAWNGFHGVELFFVISGFILALPFAAHFLKGGPRVGLTQYFLRRLTRLEPPYVLAMVLLFALHVLVRGRSAAQLWPHLAASLVYLHNLVFGSESAINNVAWSLEVEVQFYVLVPLLSALFAIRRKPVRRAVVAGLCLACALGSYCFIEPGQRAYLSILRFLHYFLVGFLLADVFLTDWNERPERAARWDLVSLFGWPLLFFAWSTAEAPARGPLLAALLIPPAVFLLYCAAFRGALTSRLVANPWVATIGGMCYTIYLLHNPILNMVLTATRGIAPTGSYSANLLVQLLLAAPAVLLPSALFFVLVEKPCMRRDWPRRLLERALSLPTLLRPRARPL